MVAGCPWTFPGPSAVPAFPDSSHPTFSWKLRGKERPPSCLARRIPFSIQSWQWGVEAGIFSRPLAEVAMKTIPPPTSSWLVWSTPEPHRGALALFSNPSAFPIQHFEAGTPNGASGKRSKGNLPGASVNGNSWNRQSAGLKA